MTIAEALIAVQDAVGDKLKASTALMNLVSGVYDYYPDRTTAPYVVFAGAEPLYEEGGGSLSVAGEANGTRLRGIVLTVEIYDDAPGRLRTLSICKEVELALDLDLSLSYGSPVCRQDVRPRRTQPEVMDGAATGMWILPVEVTVNVSGV